MAVTGRQRSKCREEEKETTPRKEEKTKQMERRKDESEPFILLGWRAFMSFHHTCWVHQVTPQEFYSLNILWTRAIHSKPIITSQAPNPTPIKHTEPTFDFYFPLSFPFPRFHDPLEFLRRFPNLHYARFWNYIISKIPSHPIPKTSYKNRTTRLFLFCFVFSL